MSTQNRQRRKFRRNPGRAWAEQFARDTKFQRMLKRRGQKYNDHPGLRMLAQREWVANQVGD